MTAIRTEGIPFFSSNRVHRTSQLTCGQRFMWQVLRDLAGIETFNIFLTIGVDPPQDIEIIKAKIGWFVERQEALRTSFSIGENGDPRQTLRLEGTIPVTIVDTDDDNVTALTDYLIGNLKDLPFELPIDLPVRCGIVELNSQPHTVIFAFSHLVVDGWSSYILKEEFLRILTGPIEDDAWPRPWSPFDQADWERSVEGREILNASLSYWKTTVEQFPRATFYKELGCSQNDRVFRWRSAELNSPAMGTAAQLIAERNGVSTATVLLASFAIVISHLVNTKLLATTVDCFNRISDEAASAIGTYPQEVPVIFNLDMSDFSVILKQAHFALINAYLNARAWPPSVEILVRERGKQRGIKIDLDTFFNFDHKFVNQGMLKKPLDEVKSSIRKDLVSTKIIDREPRKFDIHTFSIKSYSRSKIFMLADLNYIEVEKIHQILSCVEGLIVTIALNPSSDVRTYIKEIGLIGYQPAANWCYVDRSWIDLRAVTSYFLSLEIISDFSVFPSKDAEYLIAYYVLRSPDNDAGEIHNLEHADLLVDRSTMIPKVFVQCERSPTDDKTQEESWQLVPVLTRAVRTP
nr:condensation domain-containing protein [Rhizobium rhizogenes]